MTTADMREVAAAPGVIADMLRLVQVLPDDDRDADAVPVDVPPAWAWDGRVFGGYAAALCALLGARRAPGMMIGGMQVSYVDATRPGPATLEIERLVSRPQSLAFGLALRQRGAVTTAGQVRMVPPARGGTAEPDGVELPDPDACIPLEWTKPYFHVHQDYEERVIEYPASAEVYRSGGRAIELWARPARGPHHPPRPCGQPRITSQLDDVVLLDAHLLDPVYQQTDVRRAVSMDLSISWLAAAGPAGDWTHVRADVELTRCLALARGVLRDRRGGVRARAMTQGHVRRRAPFRI